MNDEIESIEQWDEMAASHKALHDNDLFYSLMRQTTKVIFTIIQAPFPILVCGPAPLWMQMKAQFNTLSM